MSSKTRTSDHPVFSDNASNISFLRCSARTSSSSRLPRAITRADSHKQISIIREYDLPLGYYSALSSQDGAQRLAYYIGWVLRPEYQMARFYNMPETKLTDITVRIKAIGKTCGRPRLASLSLSTRPTLSRVRHFSCLTFAISASSAGDFVAFAVKCDSLLLHTAGMH